MKEIPSIEEVVRGLELDEGSGLVDSTQAELVLNDIQQDSEQDSSYNWTSSVLPKEMASNLQILLRSVKLFSWKESLESFKLLAFYFLKKIGCYSRLRSFTIFFKEWLQTWSHSA